MAWLDRIATREARRLGERAGSISHEQVGALQRQVARLTHQLEASRLDVGGNASHFASSARHIAGDAARDFGRFARHEGAAVAMETARQALRAGRHFKADPFPVIVGAFGVAMVARLLMPSRRTATRS